MALEPIDVKYFKYAVGGDIGKETPNDITARCIICGDSKNKRKKRLHLYTKSGYDHDVVRCFNCEWSGNMFTFLKEASPHLYEQYKNEKRNSSFEWLKKQSTKKEQDFDDVNIWLGVKPKEKKVIEDIEEIDIPMVISDPRKMPDNVFFLPKEFIPAKESVEASEYLKGRRIPTEGIYYSKSWIKFNGKDMPLKDSIIIPLWANQEENICYGFQARSINTKFFYTYIPEENTGWKVWNLYGIDDSKLHFIFESVFDAKSSGIPEDQIVAALGSDLNEERINEIRPVVFCFDNHRMDSTAKKKMKKLLKQGEHVFIWGKLIKEKDFNEMLKNGWTRHEIKEMIKSNIYKGVVGITRML